MNEILTNNYDDMDDMEILVNGQNGLYVVIKRMASDNKKRDQRLDLLEKYDKEKKDRLDVLEDKLDYINSPNNSYMYSELRTICCKRIEFLLNTVGDGLYKNFWKSYLDKNIHTYLCKHFNVGKSAFIKTKDFEEAKLLASNYVPNDFYLKNRLESRMAEMEKGILNLSKDRLLSFRLYLTDSNYGEINLFNL